MKKRFLPKAVNCLDGSTGLSRKSYLFFSVVFLYVLALCGWFGVVHAQSVPLIEPLLPSSQAVSFQGNPSASGIKPQIPYLEELRQIQSLKQSYDTLKTQLKVLRQTSVDTTLKDSAVNMAASRGRVILDREKKALGNMIAKDEISDSELRDAIENTIKGVNRTQQSLETARSVSDIESLMDASEENLKALTNEWVMPKIEQHLSGTLDQGWEPVPGKVPDYFATGGLSLLEMEGNSAEDIIALAKEHAAGKGRHISDEYLRKADPEFRRVKIDSHGEIKVTKVQELKQKSAFFEPNTLAKKNWTDRTGMFLWYDPLTPFGEGVSISSGLSYGFSQQVRVFAGGVIRRHFSSSSWPQREGQGISLGMRFLKSNWAVQANLTGSEVTLIYPTGKNTLNYQGKILSSMVAIGRTVSMGSKMQSVVLAGVDPLYRKERSLSGPAIQISIGFEFEHLSKAKKKS